VSCWIASNHGITANGVDILGKGYRVTVLADAVSASSPEENEIALLRLRQAGVQVMSFESWLFATVKTASHPKYVLS
jgi:nicotinamidase-related amidase